MNNVGVWGVLLTTPGFCPNPVFREICGPRPQDPPLDSTRLKACGPLKSSPEHRQSPKHKNKYGESIPGRHFVFAKERLALVSGSRLPAGSVIYLLFLSDCNDLCGTGGEAKAQRGTVLVQRHTARR